MKYIAHQRDADKFKQSLENHLSNVAQLAKNNASKIGLAQHGELIGLLHDLGKYSQKFQNYLNSAVGNIDPDADEYTNAKAMKGKIDHSSAGAQLIWQTLSEKGQIEGIVAQVLALCIASHHSGLIDNLTSNKKSLGEDSFSKRMAKCDDKTHLQEATEKMDNSIRIQYLNLIEQPELISNLQNILTNIGKEHSKSLLLFQFHSGLLIRFLFSCLIDADRQDSADFENTDAAKQRQNGSYKGFSQLLKRLENRLSSFNIDSKVNEIRHQISNECLQAAEREQGIFTLSVPTGGGKTLASLRFALRHAEKYKLDRIIYIVPFTSIIDQNAQDARETLEDKDGTIVLEHHSNLTFEDKEDASERHIYRNKILSENWDAPIVYTTSVQFLEALFSSGTRSVRRMHQLANSVIIFDEIQTLPINCTHIFCNAINFLTEQCKSSVVLCTATQPLLNKIDPQKGRLSFTEKDEIVNDTQKLFEDLKRVKVFDKTKVGGWSFDEIANLAIDEVEDSNSCLVIVNTKKAAEEIYKLCRDSVSYRVIHLSTNMCPAHRKEILAVDEENKLLSKWNGEKEDTPEIFKIMPTSQSPEGAFVRWKVEKQGELLSATWEDRHLMEAWINYYTTRDATKGLCMASGKEATFAEQHPSGLRHGADKAKLISSNDKVGYTFRGRFTDKNGSQACTISSEITQKAHNTLRWLIQREQAYRSMPST